MSIPESVHQLPSITDTEKSQGNRINEAEATLLTGIALSVNVRPGCLERITLSGGELTKLVNAAFAASDYRRAMHFMINLAARSHVVSSPAHNIGELRGEVKRQFRLQAKDEADYLRGHLIRAADIFNPPPSIVEAMRLKYRKT